MCSVMIFFNFIPDLAHISSFPFSCNKTFCSLGYCRSSRSSNVFLWFLSWNGMADSLFSAPRAHHHLLQLCQHMEGSVMSNCCLLLCHLPHLALRLDCPSTLSRSSWNALFFIRSCCYYLEPFCSMSLIFFFPNAVTSFVCSRALAVVALYLHK